RVDQSSSHLNASEEHGPLSMNSSSYSPSSTILLCDQDNHALEPFPHEDIVKYSSYNQHQMIDMKDYNRPTNVQHTEEKKIDHS
ncbi:hypothetical protein R0J91_19065, partial [Micrococcus sp. SIMBA_131]